MAKATFIVVAILPGRRGDYFDFWMREIKINDKGEELHPAMLATTVSIDARSKIDAESQVRQKYPNYSIDSAATKRLG